MCAPKSTCYDYCVCLGLVAQTFPNSSIPSKEEDRALLLFQIEIGSPSLSFSLSLIILTVAILHAPMQWREMVVVCVCGDYKHPLFPGSVHTRERDLGGFDFLSVRLPSPGGRQALVVSPGGFSCHTPMPACCRLPATPHYCIGLCELS